MPTITLDRKVFEKLVGKKLATEQLADRIAMLGTDVAKIDAKEIVVEVFPNRPDMLSEQGFVRAFAAFIGTRIGLKEYRVNTSNEQVIVDSSVSNVRPYTACALVRNLKFTDEKIREIIDIQEKLHVTFGRNRRKAAIGIYPAEKIKFPVYFKALEPEKIKFQPLESNREMTAMQILREHKSGREYGKLLEGKKKFPIFVDSSGEILSMPPIINSHSTGKITKNTQNVFIECSGFDLETLNIAINIIVSALADMQGKVYSVKVKYGNRTEITPNLQARRMKINLSYINKILGLQLKDSDVKKFVERMGYGYSGGNVFVPSYRADILHEIDIAEDIAIAYGYENFKPEVPKIATIAAESKNAKFTKKVADILVGLELLEVSNFALISKEDFRKTGIQEQAIELENALEERKYLRNSLFPVLFKTLASNVHNKYPQKIFELGVVFKSGGEIKEQDNLAVALTDTQSNFTNVRQILDALFKRLGINYLLKEVENSTFISGRCGKIIMKGKEVGIIGEVHPQVLRNWKLEVPCAAFELNLDELI